MKVHLTKPEDRGEPVAYVTHGGSLVIRMAEAAEKSNEGPSVILSGNEGMADRPARVWAGWRPENPDNKAVFYRGDTITITF